MKKPKGLFAVILAVIVAASSFAVLCTAHAALAAPATPEFTVEFVDNSYDLPPTYAVDHYTGQTVQTTPSLHVQNSSIVISIKNQPFTPYKDAKGNFVNVLYNVSSRGHFGGDWNYYHTYPGCFDTPRYFESSYPECYTVIHLELNKDETGYCNPAFGTVLSGGQIDFRVQECFVYFTVVENPPLPIPGYEPYSKVLNVVDASNWSSTQTLIIDETKSTTTIPTKHTQSSPAPTETATPTLNPTETPTVQESQTDAEFSLDWEQVVIASLVVVVAAMAVCMFALWRKISK